MATPKPKRSFLVTCPQPKAKQVKTIRIPKAEEILASTEAGSFQGLSPLEMPDELVRIIGHPAEAFGFDLETHDKAPPKRKGRYGAFGNYTLRSEEDLDFLRIVQLGWAAVDPVSKKCFPKSYLVKPVGFVITEGVTEIHKIAHDDALCKGSPLAEVLQEFMQDVRGAVERNGRVIAHQIEFDAGIILRELRRCGMDDQCREWATIARNGFCTMSPVAGRWLREACGLEAGAPTSQPCLPLELMTKILAPSLLELLSKKHHEAGVDAQITRSLYLALCQCTDPTKMEAYIAAEQAELANSPVVTK